MYRRITTSMASFCRNRPPEEAMRMVAEAGFEGLDFPLSVYADGYGAPLTGDNWRRWAIETAVCAERLRLPVVQAHAPWGQPIGDGFRYEAPWDIFERVMEVCHILGCRNLIFHPLRQPDRVDSAAMRQRIHDYNVRWFHDLLPWAERYDIVINLENTFDSHHVQRPSDPPYPYTRAEDMLALQRDIGSSRVMLCLDTGHANIEAQDVPAMIRAYRGELATVHLNDNYGRIGPIYEDLHLFPGSGLLDWSAIFSALREIGFSGAYNMEPIAALKRQPDELRHISLRAAATILRSLAEKM